MKSTGTLAVYERRVNSLQISTEKISSGRDPSRMQFSGTHVHIGDKQIPDGWSNKPEDTKWIPELLNLQDYGLPLLLPIIQNENSDGDG